MDDRVGREEAEVLDRLGVPASATEVVVVAESSHWDPNWLLTSDRYYRLCVRPALDRALDGLAANRRRVHSLECVFFLDLYWKDRPHRRNQVRDLVNEGRLRLTGSGVTTPDTLLPDDELLLRDLLIGQQWLRDRGMHQEPRLLYLPDSFGHSPALPSLLAAAGVEYAAVCRIDGMRFPGADLEPAANFPRPGSSAARLVADGTADFVWRSGDGSEVLTHWMAHGYGHGDMIASGGISRAMGLPLSWPDRRPGRVDRRVTDYLADLRPLARTPYRLLAVGFDFVRPVPDLLDVLDAWNDRHHERTGTWLVNAAIDDYLDLVAAHRDALPTIELDPNPYWTGFYATRPDLKDATRELGRRLIAADARRAAASLAGDRPGTGQDDRAWWTAVTSNHHDFVTGTAPDRVARGEQAEWLSSAIGSTPSRGPRPVGPDPELIGEGNGPLDVRRDWRLVIVAAAWGTATFDPLRGGALVGLVDAAGAELLAGPSLELVSHTDSGGLWRMGQEIHGGRWAVADRTTLRPAAVDARREGPTVEVTVRARLEGRPVTLRHTLHGGSATIVTRTSVHAPARRTVTLVVRQTPAAAGLTMHQPGGLVDRPLQRWYDPTFWPLHSFATVRPERDDQRPGSVAVAAATPTGIHVEADGTAEVVVARTAVKEVAFGVVPVMAPAWGRRWGRQGAVLALGWQEPTAPAPAATALGRRLVRVVDAAAGRPTVEVSLTADDPDIDVTAVKPADRGGGTIVRLRDWAPPVADRRVMVTLGPDLAADLVRAHLVDSRERDLRALPLHPAGAEVPIAGHLTTVRLVTEPRHS